VNALRSLPEPEFTETVRRTLSRFANRWVSAIAGNGNPIAHATSNR
jgi:hypothetical protein